MSREQEFGAGCAVGDVRRGGLMTRYVSAMPPRSFYLLANFKAIFTDHVALRFPFALSASSRIHHLVHPRASGAMTRFAFAVISMSIRDSGMKKRHCSYLNEISKIDDFKLFLSS